VGEETEVLYKPYIKDIKSRYEEKKEKIIRGHDLAPGVIKIVKVYLANKRRNQPGDQMAGTPPPPGVNSEILPAEDTQKDNDGHPKKKKVNLYGVPSRMNVNKI
jgi:DNA-directed RNA polymerase, beta subunit/140 kD subunit